MEICKAPTLRLKALNKHTHIMYIEMENVIQKKERSLDIIVSSASDYRRVQELCESRGGRPGLSVLMSLSVSVDVKRH